MSITETSVDASFTSERLVSAHDLERSAQQEQRQPKKLKIQNDEESSSATSPVRKTSACGIFARMLDACVDQALDGPLQPEDLDMYSSSGLDLARKIVAEIFNKATEPKKVKRIRKPQMKSGWMDWSKAIPDFDTDDETFKQILFTESVLVGCFEGASVVPESVGALTLDVQGVRGGPIRDHNREDANNFFLYPKFLVHLSSQLLFKGMNGGSRITALVDRDMQTLEERRREYLQRDEGLEQQVLYVNAHPDFYYLRHNKKTDIFYSPQRAKNLICEGSNLVLMRYLAITNFVCKGPSSGMINNKKMDVCKIYRTIIEKCGIEHKSMTLMSLHGQILKQEWRFCNYILQINPLVDVTCDKPIHDHIPLELKAFTEDLQLLSLFLDGKSRNKKIIENYMEDHPEIKDMLADYLQTILTLKPEDVFEFTAKYFLAFTPALLPLSEYFEGTFIDDDDDYEFWRYI